MTTEIDWDNAPEGAEFYAFGEFKKEGNYGGVITFAFGKWMHSCYSMTQCVESADYCERPQQKPKYEYGVEYPTKGKKPDLPDDVIVCFAGLYGFYPYKNPVEYWNWSDAKSFRIVDERYKPKPPVIAQEALKDADPVNHPKHYAIAPGVEAIDIIKASLTPEQFEGYLLGNFLKYRLRAGDKDDLQQDIAKSNWYRNKLNEK